MAYWLLKTEPESYSIDHLEREGIGTWDGVRNYSARNHLRAMRVGERAFFYHSSCAVPGVAGICEVVEAASPDPSQFDPASKYFDPKATPERPRWDAPKVKLVERFGRVVPLAEIRETPALAGMVLVQRSRLSVQPVGDSEWAVICGMAERGE